MWSELVGSLAERSEPFQIRGTIVTVATDAREVAEQLTFSSKRLLAAFNDLGAGVTHVGFSVSPTDVRSSKGVALNPGT